MHKFKRCLGLAAVGTLFAVAPAAHAVSATNTFDGNPFNVQYGLTVIPSLPFTVSAQADATGNAGAVEIANLAGWKIDTVGNTLSLTWNKVGQFMNSNTLEFIGFKISDTGGHLSDILGVSVTNTAYTDQTYGNLVEGFNPAQVTFDANNIYVDLDTAMWHSAPMPGMGDPFRDTIALSVNFQAAPVPEPETYAMLLAGLGLMGAVVRRRRATQLNKRA